MALSFRVFEVEGAEINSIESLIVLPMKCQTHKALTLQVLAFDIELDGTIFKI